MGSTTQTGPLERFALHRDPHPARLATFADDVKTGLGVRPYALSPKYFYDDLGSTLFEAITRLPEYYLTRVERDLLASYGREIVASLGGPRELLELGSGSALKTELVIAALLDRQPSLVYHPIDISAEALVESSRGLLGAHPRLRISAHAGDYFSLLAERDLGTREPVLALYLGSNIGNFEPAEARRLLVLLAAALKPGDALVIGYDLKKDAQILELAYDDRTGVTAAFNKNLLARMNRELGADFDLDAFTFRATYDRTRGAIDSYLVAQRSHVVRIPAAGIDVPLRSGETIHTESSYKFSPEDIAVLARACGFEPRATYTDAAGRYALGVFLIERGSRQSV